MDVFINLGVMEEVMFYAMCTLELAVQIFFPWKPSHQKHSSIESWQAATLSRHVSLSHEEAKAGLSHFESDAG